MLHAQTGQSMLHAQTRQSTLHLPEDNDVNERILTCDRITDNDLLGIYRRFA